MLRNVPRVLVAILSVRIRHVIFFNKITPSISRCLHRGSRIYLKNGFLPQRKHLSFQLARPVSEKADGVNS